MEEAGVVVLGSRYRLETQQTLLIQVEERLVLELLDKLNVFLPIVLQAQVRKQGIWLITTCFFVKSSQLTV